MLFYPQESISLPILCSVLDQRRGDLALAPALSVCFLMIYFHKFATHFHDKEEAIQDNPHSIKAAEFQLFYQLFETIFEICAAGKIAS